MFLPQQDDLIMEQFRDRFALFWTLILVTLPKLVYRWSCSTVVGRSYNNSIMFSRKRDPARRQATLFRPIVFPRPSRR